ncbi:hypothetical protein BLNAU_13078 [Blattamonas nauphoetae]|uniref:Uncharacterized protein n=1 Tax=Blattamonas nauphoetae TaxID=2049346 RepID=A0ABQ9XL98_9EUKA|nr:hypothetical protein BLNAU_13075 [Blattamonas nauphoetae]KAK2951978.1 hypothetical protein BLNAU_13078 [Blattamonas nauphoetae]
MEWQLIQYQTSNNTFEISLIGLKRLEENKHNLLDLMPIRLFLLIKNLVELLELELASPHFPQQWHLVRFETQRRFNRVGSMQLTIYEVLASTWTSHQSLMFKSMQIIQSLVQDHLEILSKMCLSVFLPL